MEEERRKQREQEEADRKLALQLEDEAYAQKLVNGAVGFKLEMITLHQLRGLDCCITYVCQFRPHHM